MKKLKHNKKFLLSGGGTGGHIYPAIAIANALKTKYPDADFLFVGAKGRMEMEKVPQAGYRIKGLWISGIQRNLTIKNFFKNTLFPLKLLLSLWKAWRILKKFKPNVVIGTGGFASGPTLFMASKLGISTLIQEQNFIPGITNHLLAKKVNRICVAYEGLERFFPKEKIVLTGNPIRQELLDIHSKRSEALQFFNLNPHKKTLLILGGSLGARAINQLVANNLEWLQTEGLQVLWQTGKLYINTYDQYNNLEQVQTHAFFNNMNLAYAAADFIISRSGAIAVSELCVVGKPVIFIPSPNVAEDHQTKNALAISSKKAAILVKESEANSFKAQFHSLLHDELLQQTLGQNIQKLAMPNAAKAIAEEVEEFI